jgi:hypothetical protein
LQIAVSSGPARPGAATTGLEGRVRATFADSAMSLLEASTGPERPGTAPIVPDRPRPYCHWYCHALGTSGEQQRRRHRQTLEFGT